MHLCSLPMQNIFLLKNNKKLSRPQNNRTVLEPPIFTNFKPIGIRGVDLSEIKLTLDEFEAFRLVDYLGFSHEETAEEMEVSRSTVTRLIEKTRKKIADFIINGKLLTISGGNIHFRKNIIHCKDCGHKFNTNFEKTITECPICHSKNIINLAGGFGHGKCCEIQRKK